MDRGAWWAAVHGVTKGQPEWLSRAQTYKTISYPCNFSPDQLWRAWSSQWRRRLRKYPEMWSRREAEQIPRALAMNPAKRTNWLDWNGGQGCGVWNKESMSVVPGSVARFDGKIHKKHLELLEGIWTFSLVSNKSKKMKKRRRRKRRHVTPGSYMEAVTPGENRKHQRRNVIMVYVMAQRWMIFIYF